MIVKRKENLYKRIWKIDGRHYVKESDQMTLEGK